MHPLLLGLALLVAMVGEARADATFGLSISVARDDDGARVVDDAWVAAQVEDANRLFEPLGTSFRWTMEKELPAAHAELHSRAERDALTPLGGGGVIDVFLVRALEDVDEPGRFRMGVCWTGRGGRRFVVVSRIARPTVLAHELGHFFGNPHSPVTNNLMSYSRDGSNVFLDDAQAARVRSFTTTFLSSGRLRDVGPARRMP